MTTFNTDETEFTRRIELAPAADQPTSTQEPPRVPAYESAYAPPAAPVESPPPPYYQPPTVAYDSVPVPHVAMADHSEVLYVPLAVTVGDGFKFGCGFFLALALAILSGILLMAGLFALTSFMGLNLPVGG